MPRMDRLFDGIRFVGPVESERRKFYIFDAPREFFAVSERDSLNLQLTRVSKEVTDKILKRFAGKVVTGPQLDRALRLPGTLGLRALQALVAKGLARPRRHAGPGQAFEVFR